MKSKPYSTHMPLLISTVQKTKGPVIELGSGFYSTPLLHWLCLGRKLTTYEGVRKYYDIFKQYESKNHQIVFVNDWDSVEFKKCSVAFIDHEKDRRAVDTLRLRDKADYIILHDTESQAYGYNKVWSKFNRIYHWRACKPWTSLVSNKEILW